MQTIYAFSYNPAIATGTNTTGTNWRMAYQQPIMLYKGTANTIKIVVFASNQHVVDLTNYGVQVQIVDREAEEHYVTRTATITAPTSGVASVTFTEEDLHNLQHRFYHIIARLIDPEDGSSIIAGEILYLDDNYGAFTPITIEDAWNYTPTSISTTDGIQDISFTNIGQTPNTLTGFGKNYLRVNQAETAIEFADFAAFDGNIIPSINDTLNLGTRGNRWGNVYASYVDAGDIDIYSNMIETDDSTINFVFNTQTLSLTDNSTDPNHTAGDGGFLAFNDSSHDTDGPRFEIWYGNVSRPTDPPGQHSLDLHAAANSYIEFASYDLQTYMGIDDTSAFIQTNWEGPGNVREWRFRSNSILSLPEDATLIEYTGNTQLYFPSDSIQFLLKQPNDTYRTHSFDISGNVIIDGDIIPSTDVAYSLGSPTSQWKDLYVSNNTIYINNIPLSIDNTGNLTVNGNVVAGGGAALSVFNNQNANRYLNVTELQFDNPDITLSEIGNEGSGVLQVNIATGGSSTTKTNLELTNNAAPLNIWAGPEVSFTKTDYGNEVDVIDEGLSITRADYRGIYNPVLEEGWDNTGGDPDGRGSPKGTLWNAQGWTDLTNLDQRSYVTFYNSVGGNLGNNVLSPHFIMKDVANNTYYKIDFTQWGNANSGAPVSYTRQQVDPVDGSDIGSLVTFAKAGYADPFLVFDNISNEVHISRGNNQSIFNTVSELAYNGNSPGDGDGQNSPQGTEWNIDGWGNLTDVRERTYYPLLEAFSWGLGTKIVGTECVMHDIANDRYYAIKFTQWTGQGNGGGFAYTRRLINDGAVFVHTTDGNEVDVIIEGEVGITRGNNGAIYNPYDEGSWDDNYSPGGTEWNFAGNHDLGDVETRVYKTFFEAVGFWGIGNRIEGREAVMRVTSTGDYYTIKFLHWQQGGGGAFSYIRTPIDLTQINEGIRFADGTVQKTSADNPVKFRGSLGRRIEEYYGFRQVDVTQANAYELTTTMRGNYSNSDFIQFNLANEETASQFYNGVVRNVSISLDDGDTWILLGDRGGYGNWGGYYVQFYTQGYIQSATYTDGQSVRVKYWRGGEPQLWFDPERSPGGDGDFRGAIIDYHAYSSNDGTVIGQIIVSRDSGDYHVTHTESTSGSASITQLNLWHSYDSPNDYTSGEGKLYAWRIDGQDDTIKIQWKATMFYGNEFWD